MTSHDLIFLKLRWCMQFEANPEDDDAKAMARIIFDSALIESGYMLPSPKEFNQRIYDLLARSFSVKGDVTKGSEFDDTVSSLSPFMQCCLERIPEN